MEIDINQKKISIGDKYKIFTDGNETHTASREIFQLLPVINLFETGSGRPKMIINKRVSLFKAKYDITRWDNNVLEFRAKSFLRLYYQCQCGEECYELYGHRGRKYSVYKNNQQIAWWDKNAVSWFAGDNYKIIADKDADSSLLISFCLIIDNYSEDDHDGNIITVDFGNIGFQVKKFDRNWQPAN